MKQIEQLINDLTNFDTAEVRRVIVSDNKERLAELMQEQLAAGVDVTGKQRSDQYAPLTIQIKNNIGVGLGAVTDRVTFFMEGNLYASLRTKLTDTDFKIESDRPTFVKMIERIGDENYGLDEIQRLKFAEETYLPQFQAVLFERTGLKL